MAKGKKKGKGSKKKAGSTLPSYPPPVIYKTWPGKIADDQVFEEKVKSFRESIKQVIEKELVTLRIRQVDWKFHDFYLVLPKSSTIHSLRTRIANYQHNKSVLPHHIVLYRIPPEKSKYMLKNDGKEFGLSMDGDADKRDRPIWDEGFVGQLCTNPLATLTDSFPSVKSFEMMNPKNSAKGLPLNESENNTSPAKPIPGPFPVGVPTPIHEPKKGNDWSIQTKESIPCIDIFYDVSTYAYPKIPGRDPTVGLIDPLLMNFEKLSLTDIKKNRMLTFSTFSREERKARQALKNQRKASLHPFEEPAINFRASCMVMLKTKKLAAKVMSKRKNPAHSEVTQIK